MPRPKREEMKRVPAGMPRQKLKVEGKDPNRKYYWAFEEQFPELQAAGYRFEHDENLTVGEDQKFDKGTVVARPSSRSEDKKHYLMSIDKKWHKENQKLKHDQIDQQEYEMFNRSDTETTYVDKTQKSTQVLGK